MFYTYIYYDQQNLPYYVGKGRGRRAFRKESRGLGSSPSNISRVVLLPCQNEEEAYRVEMELISAWGRKDVGTGILRNLTDGGDAPPLQRGRRRSSETRQKISAAQKDRRRSSYQRFGNTSHLGFKHSAKTRRKMRMLKLGKPLSGTHRRNLSIAAKNYWRSAEKEK